MRIDEETKRPGPFCTSNANEDKMLVLEISDWVNGHSKLKKKKKESTIAGVLLREWWDRGLDLRHRVADWAVHIFREHHKEADSGAVKGDKGCEEEWVDGHCQRRLV